MSFSSFLICSNVLKALDSTQLFFQQPQYGHYFTGPLGYQKKLLYILISLQKFPIPLMVK